MQAEPVEKSWSGLSRKFAYKGGEMRCPHCGYTGGGLVQRYPNFLIMMCNRCKKFFVKLEGPNADNGH